MHHAVNSSRLSALKRRSFKVFIAGVQKILLKELCFLKHIRKGVCNALLRTIFSVILIHLYGCNVDLERQEVAHVNQLRCVMQECSVAAALTGLALQSCCHARVFFPSKIKSCTALRGSFAVVHFLPNCKTVSPSKQLSQNTAAFVLAAKQLITSLFSGWLFLPISGWNPHPPATHTSSDVIAHARLGCRIPQITVKETILPFYLNIPPSCRCRSVASSLACTSTHPLVPTAPLTHTRTHTQNRILPDITGGAARRHRGAETCSHFCHEEASMRTKRSKILSHACVCLCACVCVSAVNRWLIQVQRV